MTDSFTHVLVAKFPRESDGAEIVSQLSLEGMRVGDLVPDVMLLRGESSVLAGVPGLVSQRHGVYLFAAIAEGGTADPTWQGWLGTEGVGNEEGEELYLILHDTLSVGPNASHRLTRSAIAHRILLPGVFLATIAGSFSSVYSSIAEGFSHMHGRWAVLRLGAVETSRPAWLVRQ